MEKQPHPVSEDVLGMSSYAKLKHAFAIRDELRDLLETQLNTPRKVVRRDNAREATSREIWAEWVLESDEPDYTQAALCRRT